VLYARYIEAFVSLGIFDMGEFNYLSPFPINKNICYVWEDLNYTFKKERY